MVPELISTLAGPPNYLIEATFSRELSPRSLVLL